MSRKLTSKVDWGDIVEEEESEEQVGPVVDQQPSDEKPKQEEPPTENPDVIPEEEEADAGAPEVQGTEAKPVTGPEGGDDPDVVGHAYGNPEPIEMPETGEGKPPI